jgi:hypothetical protein
MQHPENAQEFAPTQNHDNKLGQRTLASIATWGDNSLSGIGWLGDQPGDP